MSSCDGCRDDPDSSSRGPAGRFLEGPRLRRERLLEPSRAGEEPPSDASPPGRAPSFDVSRKPPSEGDGELVPKSAPASPFLFLENQLRTFSIIVLNNSTPLSTRASSSANRSGYPKPKACMNEAPKALTVLDAFRIHALRGRPRCTRQRNQRGWSDTHINPTSTYTNRPADGNKQYPSGTINYTRLLRFRLYFPTLTYTPMEEASNSPEADSPRRNRCRHGVSPGIGGYPL